MKEEAIDLFSLSLQKTKEKRKFSSTDVSFSLLFFLSLSPILNDSYPVRVPFSYRRAAVPYGSHTGRLFADECDRSRCRNGFLMENDLDSLLSIVIALTPRVRCAPDDQRKDSTSLSPFDPHH